MYDSIREDTDKQALQQPPERMNAEQHLHQQSWQLWDYRQRNIQINEANLKFRRQKHSTYLDYRYWALQSKYPTILSAIVGMTDNKL